MDLRATFRKLKNRHYRSPEDLYRRRTRFGEINEMFKMLIYASDQNTYAPPFLANPFTSTGEQTKWRDTDTLFYEYLDADRREEALRRFQFMFDMVKDRIPKDAKILDVGCNTGFFLEQWKQRGYENLYGLDPSKVAVAYAHEHRPYLKITEGFFGPKANDIPCDLLVFFGSVSRVPYRDRLFDAIDRIANKYVLIWLQDSLDDFNRDFHVGLAKKGLLCIEKRVVNRNYVPIGMPGADGPLIYLDPASPVRRDFHCHYLFRRVEPRG